MFGLIHYYIIIASKLLADTSEGEQPHHLLSKKSDSYQNLVECTMCGYRGVTYAAARYRCKMLPVAMNSFHSFIATGGNNITRLLTRARTRCTRLSTCSQTRCRAHNSCSNSLHSFEHSLCALGFYPVAFQYNASRAERSMRRTGTLLSILHCYRAATIHTPFGPCACSHRRSATNTTYFPRTTLGRRFSTP